MKKRIIIAVLTVSISNLTFKATAQEVKDSTAKSTGKYLASIADKKITDNIIATSAAIQQLYKKIAADSIAQSNIIRQLYKKIAADSIAQSRAIKQLYNRVKEDSTAGILQPSNAGVSQPEVGGEETEQPTLTIDAGRVFSTFQFINSQGNQLTELTTNNTTTSFGLGYQYPLQNGLFIRANIGLRKGGASMIYEGLNINWNIQYADANIGLGYMYNKWRLKPYFSLSPYLGYMQKGSQTIGADTYDIKKEKSMKTNDFGLFFSPGLKIALTKSIAFYAEYKYILGLNNLETATTDKKSYNRGWAINMGVAVTLNALKLK